MPENELGEMPFRGINAKNMVVISLPVFPELLIKGLTIINETIAKMI